MSLSVIRFYQTAFIKRSCPRQVLLSEEQCGKWRFFFRKLWHACCTTFQPAGVHINPLLRRDSTKRFFPLVSLKKLATPLCVWLLHFHSYIKASFALLLLHQVYPKCRHLTVNYKLYIRQNIKAQACTHTYIIYIYIYIYWQLINTWKERTCSS